MNLTHWDGLKDFLLSFDGIPSITLELRYTLKPTDVDEETYPYEFAGSIGFEESLIQGNDITPTEPIEVPTSTPQADNTLPVPGISDSPLSTADKESNKRLSGPMSYI